METAKEIAEYLLERTGTSLLSGEFDIFQRCFHLPTDVETGMGWRRVTTVEALREVYDRVRWHYRAEGVTDVDRTCISAAFLNDETILSTHETRLLQGAALVQAPFRAISEISKRSGIWRISRSAYAIQDSLRHNRALSGPDAETPPPTTD